MMFMIVYKNQFHYLVLNYGVKEIKHLDQANSLRTTLGDAPGTNFGYEAAKDENGVIAHYNLDELNQLNNHENV